MTNTSPATPSISNEDSLVQILPSAARLALAYAPKSARMPTLALFALDARLAGLLRHSREPMLAQLRLSWWRETLRQNAEQWPEGEPLLEALRSWNGHHQALGALIEGWESLTGPAPLGAPPLAAMAAGRGDAFAALARALGRANEEDAARAYGRQWALADLALRLSHPQERAEVTGLLAQEHGVRRQRLSRPLRPLLVLHGLAMRRFQGAEEGAAISPAGLLTALRLGLLGR